MHKTESEAEGFVGRRQIFNSEISKMSFSHNEVHLVSSSCDIFIALENQIVGDTLLQGLILR